MTKEIPTEVLRAYGETSRAKVVAIPSLINRTYRVEPLGGPAFILQRLHPVFGPRVHEDIEAVTAHLSQQGLETPHLLRTRAGALWIELEDEGAPAIWRAQTYLEGVTVHHSESPSQLASAGSLVARFHRAASTLRHDFVHKRPLHDTKLRLWALRQSLQTEQGCADAEAQALGAEILEHAGDAQLDFSSQPTHVVHGDLKISNVLFHAQDPERARCLIDLDTFTRGPLAYELGDALRSWCNPAGEDVSDAELRIDLFEAAIEGYVSASGGAVAREELATVVAGLETISLELASRYAADVVDDTYWGWDPARFSSRREHNLLRARGQLALSRDVRRKRRLLVEKIRGTR